jgi:hypothetical protein
MGLLIVAMHFNPFPDAPSHLGIDVCVRNVCFVLNSVPLEYPDESYVEPDPAVKERSPGAPTDALTALPPVPL